MRACKYLIVPWTVIAVYTLSSLLAGAMGFSSFRQLEDEKYRQEKNMEQLQRINSDLKNATDSLLYDKDTLGVYARGLGYGKPGEVYLRIVGLGGLKKTKTEAGELVLAKKPEYIGDTVLKLTALLSGALLFAVLLFFDVLSIRKNTLK
ncbi:MAG: septum formation initiator family protein [Treponema sp.]|jgi:cell division protein FtsB|nr:septum formation initiator family protein [Treponema sp.]